MTSWSFWERQISADKINSMTPTRYDIYYQEEYFGLIYQPEGWVFVTNYLDKNEDEYSIKSGPYYYLFEVLLMLILKVIKNYGKHKPFTSRRN